MWDAEDVALVGQSKGLEEKNTQKREVYVIKLSAYLLFVLPAIISGVSI